MSSSTAGDKSAGNSGPELSRRLIAVGYLELFHRLNEDAINEVWQEGQASQALRQMAVDSSSPQPARFLAAEILSYKDAEYPRDEEREQLASVYSMALSQNFTQIANPWGLPGTLDGLAGQHFVALGEAAVPELTEDLNDQTRLVYVGSKEAAIGNSFAYRVKDAAAFFISQIRKLPFEVHASPETRDEEIEKLKNSLK
jgi:hypothetical protein